MPFKIKAWLSDKQLFRAKFTTGWVAAVVMIGLTVSFFAEPVEAEDEITWPLEPTDMHENNKWSSVVVTEFPRGRIVHFSRISSVCDSWVLFPGIPLLPRALTSIFYGLALIYLFMGIGVVSDIFMESIEKITS
jgi:hypothetical protein